MGLLRKYNHHLLKRGYNGPISFHTPFELGQIIVFDRRTGFTPAGHIRDSYFGLEAFTPNIIKGQAAADLDFGSETGVSIEIKLKGTAKIPNSKLSLNDSGFRITFDNEASYILLTKGTTVDIIENTAKLGDMVKSLYKQGNWNRNWMIMTHIVNAENTTLLIAQKNGAVYELKADGNFSGFKQDLISSDIKFSLTTSNGIYTSIVGQKGPFNPLFKLQGVKIRRIRPVGSVFKSINKLDSMDTFTISRLNHENPEFEVDFDECTLDAQFDETDDII